jgi:phosphoribosylamine---glycine ligase
MSERILVIGSGGREHALVRQLAAGEPQPVLFAAPGNPGTSSLAQSVMLDVNQPGAVAGWCVNHDIDTVIIGPEDPLINGVADALRDVGVAAFGPGAAGARLEGDKHWAKQIMEAAGIPTARYEDYHDLDSALAALDHWEAPLVVKACGAAQGKGVAVCSSVEEAACFLKNCFTDDRFGSAGRHVLIEQCLTGPELSVLAVTDGDAYALLAPSRDHKRVGEGDTGPNTGGMGAFASGCLVDTDLSACIGRDVIEPTLAELRRRGIPFRGVLYAGLMLTADGPMVLEYNCRFGDPETQVVLPLLQGRFADLITAVANGTLATFLAELPEPPDTAPDHWPGAALTRWDQSAVVVVGAAEGYPGSYPKDRDISLPVDEDQAWIIHAGTKQLGDRLVTSGGRVLGAVGVAEDFPAARQVAYALLDQVQFEGMHHRRDIGAGFEES